MKTKIASNVRGDFILFESLFCYLMISLETAKPSSDFNCTK
jgi:hypothetical protein